MAEVPMNEADTQVKAQRSWLRKNWRPALVIWLAVCASGAVLGFAVAFFESSSSEITSKALATAERNPLLSDRLGSPLHKGWLLSGSVETTPASGHAELAIPVSGPKGSGTLYVEAHKQAGLWKIDLLQFGAKESDERTDLLSTTPHASQAP